ncbi:hypothetical protein MRX96_029433 [Rhipicephalus microplus]
MNREVHKNILHTQKKCSRLADDSQRGLSLQAERETAPVPLSYGPSSRASGRKKEACRSSLGCGHLRDSAQVSRCRRKRTGLALLLGKELRPLCSATICYHLCLTQTWEFASQQSLAPSFNSGTHSRGPPRPVPGSRFVSSVACLCKPSGDGASQETRLRRVSDVRLRLDLVADWSQPRKRVEVFAARGVGSSWSRSLLARRHSAQRTSRLFALPAISRTFTDGHSQSLLRSPGVLCFQRPAIPSTVGVALKEGQVYAERLQSLEPNILEKEHGEAQPVLRGGVVLHRRRNFGTLGRDGAAYFPTPKCPPPSTAPLCRTPRPVLQVRAAEMLLPRGRRRRVSSKKEHAAHRHERELSDRSDSENPALVHLGSRKVRERWRDIERREAEGTRDGSRPAAAELLGNGHLNQN